MAVKYKKKCIRCKKNYVLVTWRERFPTCFECQKNELNGEIDDPKMKKMFDIPDEFYKENGFLRSIKVNYIRYGGLSEPQIEAFKKTVKKMKDEKKE
ncbi:hypothetical protein HOC35_04730 [Candidatus Woesearchaeota archaeon]|nr:hypothetical protein [Candidatus Woesearchaeota archaeon]